MGLSCTPLGFTCPTLETTTQHPSLSKGTLLAHKKKNGSFLLGTWDREELNRILHWNLFLLVTSMRKTHQETEDTSTSPIMELGQFL